MFKKVLIFIATIVVILFINLNIEIIENKQGVHYSRTLTFTMPIIIALFVIFKFGKDTNKP